MYNNLQYSSSLNKGKNPTGFLLEKLWILQLIIIQVKAKNILLCTTFIRKARLNVGSSSYFYMSALFSSADIFNYFHFSRYHTKFDAMQGVWMAADSRKNHGQLSIT